MGTLEGEVESWMKREKVENEECRKLVESEVRKRIVEEKQPFVVESLIIIGRKK